MSVETNRKSDGTTLAEVNTDWAGTGHEIEREQLLYRLERIEKYSASHGYYGLQNCKVCGTGIPYGARSYGGVEWSSDIYHYIEFHGHKPTDAEVEAITFSFNEHQMRQEASVKEGIFRKEQRAKQEKANQDKTKLQ
jgi:hypothetical protein